MKQREISPFDQDDAYDSVEDELRTRAFNTVLDKYLCTHALTEEEYHSLTHMQKEVIQCFKRAIKRIKKR